MSSLPYSIDGKTILVTGANRGLGKALVLALATQGVKKILATVRDLKSLDWLTDIDNKISGVIQGIELDITIPNSIQNAFEQLTETQIIINNAAICLPGSILDMPIEQVRLEWETNFFGPLHVIRFGVEYCPHLEIIANIGSKYRYVSFPAIGNYCATKSALASMTDGMRQDLQDRGIQIQMFFPGAMDTQMGTPFRSQKTSTDYVAEKIISNIGSNVPDVLLTSDVEAMFEHFFSDPDDVRKKYEAMTFKKYFEK